MEKSKNAEMQKNKVIKYCWYYVLSSKNALINMSSNVLQRGIKKEYLIEINVSHLT